MEIPMSNKRITHEGKTLDWNSFRKKFIGQYLF